MVACLEKSKGNNDFHEIVDFLTTSIVRYALTVSPTIYASYIEQIWNTAHSQTVNDVKQIHATVDGKTVVILESSVRSDIHFNDKDADEAVFKERDDRVVRATTTTASLDAAHASGNITKTQSMAISNDPLSQEIGSGDRLRVLALEQSKTAQDLVRIYQKSQEKRSKNGAITGHEITEEHKREPEDAKLKQEKSKSQ
ncbi:hypothetical protein Tco_1250344 [Tanacetum coccineum]